MSTTSVIVRIEENLKQQAETVFEGMGIDMAAAITIFAKAVVQQGRIPFEIYDDPFWNEENQAHLRKVAADLNAGKGLIVKTMEELEAMEA